MEQNDNINTTPDTREYEGRCYSLVADEIGDGNECDRRLRQSGIEGKYVVLNM